MRFTITNEISGRIRAKCDLGHIDEAANEVDDYRTMQFFDWFVKEQGEEEKSADDLLKKLVEEKTTPRNRNEQEIAGYRDVLNIIHENFDVISISWSRLLLN